MAMARLVPCTVPWGSLQSLLTLATPSEVPDRDEQMMTLQTDGRTKKVVPVDGLVDDEEAHLDLAYNAADTSPATLDALVDTSMLRQYIEDLFPSVLAVTSSLGHPAT